MMILYCAKCAEVKDRKPAERFQDTEHGRDNRVHNPCRPKEHGAYYRCTLCGTVRGHGGEEPQKNPKKATG